MGPRLVSRGDGAKYLAIHAVFLASMGPRLVSRGDRPRRLTVSVSYPGFNGAAACEPRRLAAVAARFLDIRASMGPRLVSRGDIVPGTGATPTASFNGAAACEPRRLLRFFWDLRILRLQWGRGL